MLISSVIQPTKGNVGDFWFDLSTRALFVAVPSINNIMWITVPSGTYHSPVPPVIRPNTTGQQPIWINSTDPFNIPHIPDVNARNWVPAVSVGYTFPPSVPQVGDMWHDTMSGFDFMYFPTGWTIITAQSVSGGTSYSLGITGPVGNPGPSGPSFSGHAVCPQCFSGSGFFINSICQNCGYTIPHSSAGQNAINGGQVVTHSPPPPGYNFPSGGAGNILVSNNQAASLTTKQPTTALSIAGLIDIFMDGTITYHPGYTPDKVAEAMWDAIAQFSPIYKENAKIKHLERQLKDCEALLQKYIDAGFKLPDPKSPPDPNAAWNAAMGVII